MYKNKRQVKKTTLRREQHLISKNLTKLIIFENVCFLFHICEMEKRIKEEDSSVYLIILHKTN